MILGMLQGIHDEVNDDEIMVEVAATVEFAITQLRHLQQLAYDTMIEIDAERGVTCCCRSAERKKPN